MKIINTNTMVKKLMYKTIIIGYSCSVISVKI